MIWIMECGVVRIGNMDYDSGAQPFSAAGHALIDFLIPSGAKL